MRRHRSGPHPVVAVVGDDHRDFDLLHQGPNGAELVLKRSHTLSFQHRHCATVGAMFLMKLPEAAARRGRWGTAAKINSCARLKSRYIPSLSETGARLQQRARSSHPRHSLRECRVKSLAMENWLRERLTASATFRHTLAGAAWLPLCAAAVALWASADCVSAFFACSKSCHVVFLAVKLGGFAVQFGGCAVKFRSLGMMGLRHGQISSWETAPQSALFSKVAAA